MSKGRILIVDDDRLFRTYACDILKPEGYDVWTATTGEEAFHLLKSERFDIIIVDVVMDQLSGLDLVRRIIEADPEQEIVMVTGLEDVRTAVEAMKLGISDYILKPIEPQPFLLLINKLLSRRNLALEHTRLIRENLEYFEMLSVYDRGMKFLDTVDPDRLGEQVIDTILNITNAQGGILWMKTPSVPNQLQRFASLGLVRVEDEPVHLSLESLTVRKDLSAYFPDEENRNTFCLPLTAHDDRIGLLKISERQDGTAFRSRDLKLATALAGFAGIALKNAFRFREAEHRIQGESKRDKTTSLREFRDAFEREMFRAKRYRRNLSLIRIVFANYRRLQRIVSEQALKESKETILGRIALALRETDLIGNLNEEEYLILLPETDSFDAQVFLRRLKQKTEDILKIEEPTGFQYWQLFWGVATYVQDDGDFNSLNRTALNQVEKMRRSLVCQANLESMSFWDIVRYLMKLEPDSEHFSKGGSDLYSPFTFDTSLLGKILELIGNEAIERPSVRGVMFLNESVGTEAIHSLQKQFAPGEIQLSPNVKIFFIGPPGLDTPSLPTLNPVEIEDPQLGQFPFLLQFGEQSSYGFVGQLEHQGSGSGFHTADPFLVELLIYKLQRQYSLDLKF